MIDEEQVKQLSQLFNETGTAHHQAFIESDGFDPEWASWYADYLIDKLSAVFGREFTRSEISDCLVDLSKIQPVKAPDAWWPDFYARYFSEHYN